MMDDRELTDNGRLVVSLLKGKAIDWTTTSEAKYVLDDVIRKRINSLAYSQQNIARYVALNALMERFYMFEPGTLSPVKLLEYQRLFGIKR